uniref:Uncharacterized protein n=1 Tax=Picea sitchensis TaxID=3332 RepID=A0A6B9XUQ3_PICSI|nr:hypothetical protein Q903MT_gene6673 [Picea sitchensis]
MSIASTQSFPLLPFHLVTRNSRERIRVMKASDQIPITNMNSLSVKTIGKSLNGTTLIPSFSLVLYFQPLTLAASVCLRSCCFWSFKVHLLVVFPCPRDYVKCLERETLVITYIKNEQYQLM